MATEKEENNFKSKSNNNFYDKENNSQIPEGLNHYKHCLPSFLFDDYFQQTSDGDNDSNDEKDNDKKNNSNSFDKTKKDKNISKNLLEEKTKESSILSNNIKEEDKNNLIKIETNEIKNKNIIFHSDNHINLNNNINNNINKTINNAINTNINNLGNNNNSFNMYPIFPEKNIFPNSFNDRKASSFYFQNYSTPIPMNINSMPTLEPNYNILNNNINIINNNNFMDQKNNPFYNINNLSANHFPKNFSFNQTQPKKYYNQSMNEINNPNYLNNIMFSGEFNQKKNNNKYFSVNHIMNQQQRNIPSIKKNNENIPEKHKKSNKRNKKEKQDENNIIKKMLNMPDYSLSNFLKNQKDSREAQNALLNMKESEVTLLINKLKNYISDVTLDKYGNYFTQKLFQICVPSQRLEILKNINTRFIEIANNSFGTHPLQNLMEIINMPEEKKLVLKYILGNETILSFDSKGTHILQKYISNTKDEDRIELNYNLVNLMDKLIVDISGVCVLIKLIKHSKDKIILEKIAKYITSNEPLFFIQHPYANYAIQILIMNPVALPFCDKIVETIVNNYLSLSMQKFSSNVVENCIKYADEKSVKKIYNAIIEQEKIESLLNNNYGNYVLEKLIERLNQEDKIKLAKKIEKYGKNKILANCLKSILG